MKKTIVSLALITTSAMASDHITNNQLIDYKTKYLEAEMELNRLEKIEDELTEKTNLLEVEKNKINGLEDMIFSYKFLASYRVNGNYSPMFTKYYKLLDDYRRLDYNHKYNTVYYNFIMDNYKYIVNYANENLNDAIELDKYFNVTVNGEKLIK